MAVASLPTLNALLPASWRRSGSSPTSSSLKRYNFTPPSSGAHSDAGKASGSGSLTPRSGEVSDNGSSKGTGSKTEVDEVDLEDGGKMWDGDRQWSSGGAAAWDVEERERRGSVPAMVRNAKQPMWETYAPGLRI